jgi:hypothetical protein
MSTLCDFCGKSALHSHAGCNPDAEAAHELDDDPGPDLVENPYVMGPPPGYEPPPLSQLRDPSFQERINAEGAALVRDVIATIPRRSSEPADRCPTHPDQPGGKTGAGDPWCGECRRTEREDHR